VQVTDVLVSTQHDVSVSAETVRRYVVETLAPRVLGRWHHADVRFTVNPSGSFVKGGPAADCGVTGRKIVVDTYGGIAHHGGGAFSGKDPSKVDRSRRVLLPLRRAAGGRAGPRRAHRGAGRLRDRRGGAGRDHGGHVRHRRPRGAARVRARLRLPPGRIVERLRLLRPIYRQTTNYGHFGKPGLPWEA
jgi:S-adenosylmethionine synthetase